MENFQNHIGYNKLFKPSKLTFGLIAPLKGYPDSAIPDMADHQNITTQADNVGIDAIWLRDVPFYDPNFGDVGQVFDVVAYSGWLAAKTKNIIIGTAGVILPFRDPVLLAKQALSIDNLSNGRFILGIAGGDRASEYPAMGIPFNQRVERFAEATKILKTLITEPYPKYQSEYYGNLLDNLQMYPKPISGNVPIINIGRAGQSIDWIAENTHGWIWHGMQAQKSAELINTWQDKTKGVFKPYGYGTFFELSANPDTPIHVQSNFIYGGRNALIDYWQMQQNIGISHIILNLKPSRRNPMDVLEEFGKYIVPAFK
ncbi:TIGR03571 family LLM class oxidoreductase [Myroides sp. LJL110]